MERYINSFAKENDIQIALDNGELLKPYVAYIEDGYTTEYLTFNILSAGTINWTASNTKFRKTIDYKLNNGEWTSITSNTSSSAPKINVVEGDKVQFRGNNATYSSGGTSFNKLYNSFGGSALFEIEGNIMSLIYGDDFKNNSTISSDYTFSSLFYNCTGLTSAKNLILPSTTLAQYCYTMMFYGCTSLTTAPKELPSRTLANYCYQNMFQDCSSLTTAPALPATTLANRCYSYMFDSCTSLTTAPELPATTLAQDCYKGMFRHCTSLTTASELPAMTLVEGCYTFMFNGSTKLNYIKCLATDIPTTNYTNGWVQNVASTGTFVKNPNATWTTGNNGIPNGWTVQDA